VSWEPPAYMIDPTARAIAAYLEANQVVRLTDEAARELAIAAIRANREAVLQHQMGKAHT